MSKSITCKIKLLIFCTPFNSLLLRESNGGVIFWTNPLGVTVSSWFFKLRKFAIVDCWKPQSKENCLKLPYPRMKVRQERELEQGHATMIVDKTKTAISRLDLCRHYVTLQRYIRLLFLPLRYFSCKNMLSCEMLQSFKI